MPTITFTNNGWSSSLLSSTAGSSTVYYVFATPNLDFGNDMNSDYPIKIKKITLLNINNNYGGNWRLGLVYGNGNWDDVIHMQPNGDDPQPGQVGYDTTLFYWNSGSNSYVEFTGPTNNRTSFSTQQANTVRFVLYTYTQPSGSWGISQFTVEIEYISTEPSKIEITSCNTTATNIEFEYNSTNCETPLLYCYSTNSTLQNYPINNSSSQNPSPEEWYNLPLNQNSYNFNISNPQSGQNYYLFIAGYANYSPSNTITINNNSYCYASQEFQLKSSIYPRITEIITGITNGYPKLIINMEFDENYFDVQNFNAYYFYSRYDDNFPTNNQISEYQNDPDQWCQIPSNNINEIELTRLSKNITYYVWIAAKLKSGYYSDHQITLNNENYVYSNRYSETTLNDSRCSKPTIISVTSDGITITIEWTGGNSGNYHPKTGYEIGYSISDPTAAMNAQSIHSVSSNTYTYTYYGGFNNYTTYYFRVRTIAQDSDYNSSWSVYEQLTFIQKPRVSIGSKIKANQITNLINYLSSTPKPKTVTTGNVILIGDTNSYNSNEATQYEKINADWYNN